MNAILGSDNIPKLIYNCIYIHVYKARRRTLNTAITQILSTHTKQRNISNNKP